MDLWQRNKPHPPRPPPPPPAPAQRCPPRSLRLRNKPRPPGPPPLPPVQHCPPRSLRLRDNTVTSSAPPPPVQHCYPRPPPPPPVQHCPWGNRRTCGFRDENLLLHTDRRMRKPRFGGSWNTDAEVQGQAIRAISAFVTNLTANICWQPSLQEARGLDAGPRLVQKLVGLGDNRTSNIVKRIAEEEIAHVAVGVSWILTVCGKMGRMPDKTFTELLEELNVELKGPYNYAARTEAGIPRDWYDTSNLGPARCDNKLDMKNEKERTIMQVASTEQAPCNSQHFPISHEGSKTTNHNLSEVYERLACIVAMEKESSEL